MPPPPTPEVQAVIDSVSRLTTANGALISLVQQLAQLNIDHADDKAAIIQLNTDILAQVDAIAAATIANTPVTPVMFNAKKP